MQLTKKKIDSKTSEYIINVFGKDSTNLIVSSGIYFGNKEILIRNRNLWVLFTIKNDEVYSVHYYNFYNKTSMLVEEESIFFFKKLNDGKFYVFTESGEQINALYYDNEFLESQSFFRNDNLIEELTKLIAYVKPNKYYIFRKPNMNTKELSIYLLHNFDNIISNQDNMLDNYDNKLLLKRLENC